MSTPLPHIAVAQGRPRTWTLSLKDSNGNVVSFTGSEPLAAACWGGSNQSILFSPQVSWINAAAGVLALTISAANTTSISTGDYRVTVYRSDTSEDLWEGVLDVSDAPGSSAPLSVYCAYSDLLNWYPAIADFADYHAPSQYVWQRHQARTWLESVIQRHYRTTGNWGLAAIQQGVTIPFLTSDAHNPWLKTWLDNDQLIVNSQVVEINAKRALGIVLSTVTGAGDENSNYRQQGLEFLRDADNLVKSYTAEIDLSGQGYGTVTIPCGLSSSRW